MSLNQLYQQEIKNHSRNPIGQNREFECTHQAEGYNPSCGDELNVFLRLNHKQEIEEIGFNSDACAICTASASLLCEHAEGKNLTEVQKDIDQVCESLLKDYPMPYDNLSCLSPVSLHKSRIVCALLPWQTLGQALTTPDRTDQVHSVTNHLANGTARTTNSINKVLPEESNA